jgi:hypothetical protein
MNTANAGCLLVKPSHSRRQRATNKLGSFGRVRRDRLSIRHPADVDLTCVTKDCDWCWFAVALSGKIMLAARLDDRWLILDSRWSELREDSDDLNFTPLFAINHAGVFLLPAPYAKQSVRWKRRRRQARRILGGSIPRTAGEAVRE